MLMEEKAANFSQNLELMRHFREQLAILSDARVIELLKVFGSGSFRNHEARGPIGDSRQKPLGRGCPGWSSSASSRSEAISTRSPPIRTAQGACRSRGWKASS
jgi:hypothetical protein